MAAESSKSDIYVNKPELPEFSDFSKQIESIWTTSVLTNNGSKVLELEKALCDFLEVSYVSLVANGTIGLILALKAIAKPGAACITTPFSFCATANSSEWAGLNNIFVDIEKAGVNLDLEQVNKNLCDASKLQSNPGCVVLPVHCYGFPVDIEAFEKTALQNKASVVYDAAHAFGVQANDGSSIFSKANLSVVSTHATKTFHTFEGGFIATNDSSLKKEIDLLRNFGFSGEDRRDLSGINAKMSELHAAVGLENLKHFSEQVKRRAEVCNFYDAAIEVNQLPINKFESLRPLKWNYGYYPIQILEQACISRDSIWGSMKDQGIHARRYFYPMLCDSPHIHPRAEELSSSVLCLPIYPSLDRKAQKRVLESLIQSMETRNEFS